MSTNGEHGNAELMRAMGSKKGSDPIPPDQYLYFLESDDHEQKALAYVRSKTIRMGHRSPFAVDDHGRFITVTRMAADCGWQPSHTSEYLARLEAKGLISVKQVAGNGSSSLIYLCGEVPLPKRTNQATDKANKGRTTIPCTEFLPEYLVNQISKLPDTVRQRALNCILELEKVRREIEAEAIAAARAAVEPMWDQFYTEFALKKRKLKPPAKEQPTKPARCAVQISLFETSMANPVQGNGNSVQSAAATAYGVSSGSVQSSAAAPSINTETETEKYSAAAASSVSPREAAAAAPPPPPHPDTPDRDEAWLKRQGEHDQVAEEVIEQHQDLTPILQAFQPVGGLTDSRARRLIRDCGGATPDEIAAKAAELIPGIKRNKAVHSAVAVLIGNELKPGELLKFFHSPAALEMWRRGREDKGAITADNRQPGESSEAYARRRYRDHPDERDWLREHNPDIDFEGAEQ